MAPIKKRALSGTLLLRTTPMEPRFRVYAFSALGLQGFKEFGCRMACIDIV